MEDRVKMNEQFLNYNLIKNTIPGAKNQISDGALTIGSTVKNLVVELNQDSVFNQYYPEYYGTKTTSSGWGCTGGSESEGEQTITKENTLYSSNGTVTSFTTTTTQDIEVGTKETTGFDPSNTGTFTHFDTITLSEEYSDEITYTADGEYDGDVTINGRIVLINVTSSESKIAWTFSKKQTTTTTSYKTSFIIDILSLELLDSVNNIEITSLVTTGEDSESISWENNNTLKATFSGNKSTYTINTTMKYKTIKDLESIEKGTLVHSVALKPNTTYVLQVIDALQPSNISTFSNSISTGNNWSLNFNQYLFFSTVGISTEQNFILKINGLSFSYQILGKQDNSVIEVRSIKSKEQAKVFLFESNYPWIVDKKGVVVGLNDVTLKTVEASSQIPLTPKLTTNDVKAIFSETPTLSYSSSDGVASLKIMLPDINTLNKWKHYPIWKLTSDSTECPQIIKNLRILVYRDFLTETRRRYDFNSITTRRGLVRILSKTCQSSSDDYSTVDLNDDGKFFTDTDSIVLRVTHPLVTINENTTSIDFTLTKDAVETVSQYDKEEEGTWEPFTLAIGALFGYNRQYALNNDLMGAENSKAYKYTSFCFAWGWGDGTSALRLSDFSEPILIDRSIVSTAVNDGEDIELTIADCEITKSVVDGYYKNAIIHIDKKPQ